MKKCFSVRSVRDIVPSLREAFQLAQSGTPGPVFVEIPIDVLYPYLEVASMMGFYDRKYKKHLAEEDMGAVVVPQEVRERTPSPTLKSISPHWDQTAVFLRKHSSELPPFVTRTYLRSMLQYIYADALRARLLGPLPVNIPLHRPADVAKAAEMVKACRRPVLLLQSQAVLPVKLLPQLQAALNKLGMCTFLGGMSRGLLGASGKYHVRQNREPLFRKLISSYWQASHATFASAMASRSPLAFP